MKKNAYLVKYAKAQVGKPYWFGTFGQTASEKLLKEKRKQYPKQYTAKDYPTQYGQRVHDCVGLHNGALWSETPDSPPKYNASQDLGADGLFKKAKKKGKIETFDKLSGRLVFKGSDKKKSHVGIYSEGYVYEAKGHAYGVKKTKFSASSWPYWAQSPFFEEDPKEEKPAQDPKPADKPTTSEKPAADPTPAKPKEEPKPVAYKVTATHGLRLREDPSTKNNANIITVMPKYNPKDGTLFKAEKAQKGWLYGSYGKHKGWACSDWLERV